MQRCERPKILSQVALAVILALVLSCGDDDPVVPGPTPIPPIGFSDFQPAEVIVGQPDGMSGGVNGSTGSVNGAGIDSPFGNAASGSLYIPDHINRRLLGFNAIPSSDGAVADFVVGQVDSATVDDATSASRFVGVDCHVAGGKLFVACHEENRVLVWNSLPRGDVPADMVLGQGDFTSSGPNTTQSGFNLPMRVMTGGGRLFVLDAFNNRCLIWNSIPTVNNAPADVVVGQPNFTNSGSSLTQTGFGLPRAIWTDGTALMVGESSSNRILIWNSIPTANNQPADLVVGAPDFTTIGLLFDPFGIASDGHSLFVADALKARVLIYSPIPTVNGGAPTGVLGQSNLTNRTSNDDNQDGVEDANPSRRTMGGPTSVTLVGNQLIVTDQTNFRYMVFRGQ